MHLEDAAREQMADRPYTLTDSAAGKVLQAIREVCAFRNWQLFAVHVR